MTQTRRFCAVLNITVKESMHHLYFLWLMLESIVGFLQFIEIEKIIALII